MVKLFASYKTVLYGAVLAFAVTMMSSAICLNYEHFLTVNWILIVIISFSAILLLLLLLQRSLGITLEEYTISAEEMRNIMTDFERRLSHVMNKYDKDEFIQVWGRKLSIGEILDSTVLIFIAILFLNIPLSKIRMDGLAKNGFLLFRILLLPLSLLLVRVLRRYARRRLEARVMKTEYYWRFRSILSRDPRECHVEFDNRQNMITVKYFHARELLRVIEILEDSGLPLRVTFAPEGNLMDN
jgi:hypothetical protein